MSEDHSKQDCIICFGEITKEQDERECVGDEVGGNVVRCVGCKKEKWHAGCLIRWFNKGSESCPNCRLGSKRGEVKPIVHPNSDLDQLNAIVNFIKCEKIKDLLPKYHPFVEQLAEKYEAEPKSNKLLSEEISDLTQKFINMIHNLVRLYIANYTFTPCDEEYLESEQWKTIERCIKRESLKFPEETALWLIKDYVSQALRKHFDAHVTMLRKRRMMQKLYEEDKELCFEWFKTLVMKGAESFAMSMQGDLQLLERYLNEKLNIELRFKRFYKSMCVKRVLIRLHWTERDYFNDIHLFANDMYEGNKLSAAQVQEMFDLFANVARKSIKAPWVECEEMAAAEVFAGLEKTAAETFDNISC